MVQNRVSLAEPILPDLVKRRGVTVKKKSPSVLMIVNLYSPDGSRDNLYLSNYATIQLRDHELAVPGVGAISVPRLFAITAWRLARSAADGHARYQDDGRGPGYGTTEHSVCGRSDRPASGPDGQALSIHHVDPRTGCPTTSVRRHDPAVRQRAADHPPARRRP